MKYASIVVGMRNFLVTMENDMNYKQQSKQMVFWRTKSHSNQKNIIISKMWCVSYLSVNKNEIQI